MNEISINMLGISEIRPYKNNPRINEHAIPYVEKSIKEFGFKVPLVISGSHEIICGHTRFEAAKNLGLKKVPCIVADDLSPEQIAAFRIIDNKSQELSAWDIPALNKELLELASCDFDLENFNFEVPEFKSDNIDELSKDMKKISFGVRESTKTDSIIDRKKGDSYNDYAKEDDIILSNEQNFEHKPKESYTPKIKYKDIVLELSEEEAAMFEMRLQEYMADNNSTFGFIRSILQ